MIPRLAWVPSLVATLNRATDDQILSYDVLDHIDPLKKLVKLSLGEPLAGHNYRSFYNIASAFVEANDCVLERIKKDGNRILLLEVLIKRRGGPPMKRNPLE